MRKMIPRLMFAAPRSGSGKTLLTCGFLEVLKRRGLSPRAFKCGPDYIDPMFHKNVLGVEGGNLDSFFLDGESLRRELAAGGADASGRRLPGAVTVLEGVMGYYDGLGGISTEASSYDVARLTDTPAVLVVDAKGASLSLAAEVKGFASLREDSRIRGVILNRLSPMLFDRLGPAVERETGIPVLGCLPESGEYHLESRHLGLILPDEVDSLRSRIGRLSAQMEETLDVEALIRLAEEAPPLCVSVCREPGGAAKTGGVPAHGRPSLQIGVARDEAFCFYYQENLRLLREMGAEPVFFSPLREAALPEGLDGLLLGGGYPELYARELSENSPMRDAVRAAARAGMPVLAECGGFLYLHDTLEGSDGREYPMVSLIHAKAWRNGRLGRFGYVELTAPGGLSIRGHEFHYWESSDPGTDWQARKPVTGREWRCMHGEGALICGFPHLYYPSNPDFLEGWLRRCRLWRCGR